MNYQLFDLQLSYRGQIRRAYLALAAGALSELEEHSQSFLHPKELQYLNEIPAEIRKHSFLLGRYAAKISLAGLYPWLLPEYIWLESGVFFQPIVKHLQIRNTQVSISHSGHLSAAIAFPEEVPIGIDLEECIPDREWTKIMTLTRQESNLIKYLPFTENEALTMLWTIKESVSKALKTGLTIDQNVFEISQITHVSAVTKSSFALLSSYTAYSFHLGTHFLSIAVPSKAGTDLNRSRVIISKYK